MVFEIWFQLLFAALTFHVSISDGALRIITFALTNWLYPAPRREEHRFLTFGETLDSGIGRFSKSEQYEQLGIEVVENTPEEITALAVEMDERLEGTWQTTEEDEERQRRFWSLFKPSELHGTIVSRIGAEFLRQNRELLD